MGICEEPEGSTGKFGYRTLELCLVLSLIKNKKSTQNLLVILDMSSCYSKHRHCRLSVGVPEKLFQRSLWMELHCHCQIALHLHNRMLCWPVVSGVTQRQMPDALKSNISWIQPRTWTIHRNANSWLGQSCKTRLFFQRHFVGKQLSMTWCSLNIWC